MKFHGENRWLFAYRLMRASAKLENARFATAVTLVTISSVAQVALPVILSFGFIAANSPSAKNDENILAAVPWLAGYLGAWVVGQLARHLALTSYGNVEQSAQTDLRSKFFDRSIRVDWFRRKSLRHDELNFAVDSAANALREVLSNLIFGILPAAVGIVASLIAISASGNLLQAVWFLVVICIYLASSRPLINRHQASQSALYNENMNDFSSMGNHLQMWQEIRLLKAVDYVLMRMKDRRKATHAAAIQAYKSSTILYLAQSAVIAFGIIGCWAITFAQSAVEEYELSATLAISGLMLGIASPLQSLGFGESAITAAQGKSKTAWGLLEITRESETGLGPTSQAFDNAATTPLLQKIDSLLATSAAPTGLIWVKGPSGIGKTKMVEELVAHFADNPQLHQQLKIAHLTQEPLLFHATGFENILVGRTADYTQRASNLMNALSLQKFADAGARHEDILDHDSINVSGGEKRRIALARALLDPESNLLVLDEPTDGLNRELRDNVWALIRDRATSALVVVITHDAEAPATTSDLVVQL